MTDPVTAAFLALGAQAVGMVTAAAATFAAAGSEFAPWAQVGGTATAVGALAYMAKMMVDGKLVSLPVAEIIKKAEKREETQATLIQQSQDREDALRAILLGRTMK